MTKRAPFWPRPSCPTCQSLALVYWSPATEDSPTLFPDPMKPVIVIDTDPEFDWSVAMASDLEAAEQLDMARCWCIDCEATIVNIKQSKLNEAGRVNAYRSLSFEAIAPTELEAFDLSAMYARFVGITQQQRMFAHARTRQRVRVELTHAATL